jgi:hypothetical protein
LIFFEPLTPIFAKLPSALISRLSTRAIFVTGRQSGRAVSNGFARVGAMSDADNEWENIRNDRPDVLGETGYGALRLTLLFGSAAVAFALFLVPIMSRGADSAFGTRLSGSSLDTMTTASVPGRGAYVIRRSVLQQTPQSVCVIRVDGRQTGDC